MKRKMSDEHKKNLSKSLKKTFQNGRKQTKYWLGKKMSQEHCKKISEANKGLSVGYKFKKDNKVNLGRKHTKEEIENRSEFTKGRKHSNETKKKMRKSRIKFMQENKIKYSGTDIENIMEEALIKHKIHFLKQVPVKGISIVDFYLPNQKIIIECDGDYWHSKPKQKKKDEEKTKLLSENGYKVFRFLGSEIKLSVNKCIKSL